MKKLVEVVEGKDGWNSCMGEMILVMCANHFYYGKLTGVNKTHIELTGPSLVYETGEWSAAKWKDAQKLPSETCYIRLPAIESWMRVLR